MALACLFGEPAWAEDGPEQLDQIEIEKGEWQLEYYGAFGGDGEQGVEALIAVSDRLLLGAEVELEGPRDGLVLESLGLSALVRLADPKEATVGLGWGFRAAIDRTGSLSMLETRAIAETRTPRWWLQGNLILRHVREDHGRGTGLAYGTSLQHSLGEDIWFGVEASGRLVRLSGGEQGAPEGQHYAGPSLTIERPVGNGSEVELGLAWVFVQFTF